MTPARLAVEKSILQKHFPAFAFAADGLSLEGSLPSNAGVQYRVRVDSLANYPNEMPRVFITAPLLYHHSGRGLWEYGISVKMHTLNPEGTSVQICHGRGDRWEPRDTLYLAVFKARLWVEAYEYHHKTGEPLDRWLPHQ